jgi:hypothetical protein
MGVSIPSGLDYYGCYRPGYWTYLSDGDSDGVLDSCENELAIAFKPQVVLMANDCELRRAPAFAVRQKVSPDWGGVIEIFYAISWMYDCGPYGHRGDSEWIIEEVGPSNLAGHPWALKYATLSAHWDDGFWDNTAGYAAHDLEDAQGSPGFGAPRVWVSKNKHANYRTAAACGGQLLGYQDSCAWPFGCTIFMTCTNPTYFTLDFSAAQNLGSYVVPFFGAATTPRSDPITFSGRTEYYWVPAGVGGEFCGWLAPNGIGCAGAYQKSLRAYGF